MPSSPSRRVQNSVLALSAALLAASLMGTALSPYLLVKSPLALVAISPATHHIALAAASVEPLQLIAVATPRKLLTALGAYGVGYVYGAEALEWVAQRYPRLGRVTSFVSRLFARSGVALLVLAPVHTLALLAGAARSRLLPFLVAFAVGSALWIGFTVYLGDALAHFTEQLTAFVAQHLVESTLLCIFGVGLQQVHARWTRRARAIAPPSGEL